MHIKYDPEMRLKKDNPDALRAIQPLAYATKCARDDGQMRFVHRDADGYHISAHRPDCKQSFWTTGHDVGYWKRGESAVSSADMIQLVRPNVYV